MVAMVAAGAHGNDLTATVAAGEYFITGMGLVVAFVVLFSLVFSIHGHTSSWSERVGVGIFVAFIIAQNRGEYKTGHVSFWE